MKSSVKWYEKNWFIALCFISVMFIPLGIFLIWKKNRLNKVLKMSLSLISGLIFLSVPFYLVNNHLNTETDPIIYEESIENFQSSNEETKSKIYKPPTDVQVGENQGEEPTLNETTSKKTNSLNGSENTKTNDKTASSSKEKISNNNSKSENIVEPEPSTSGKGGESKEPEEPQKTESKTVYITRSGKKYHYKNKCGSGTYFPIALEEAKNKKYTPCKKCVK